MLQLELAFPLARCFAATHDDPAHPEWPPSPSRVFSALVAAAHCRLGGIDGDSVAALQTLETLPSPMIFCPEADVSPSPKRYVPVNDIDSFFDKRKSSHPARPLHAERYFPAAFMLGEPIVRYVWSEDVNDAELRQLDKLAASMTHVGTSHSMVVGRFSRAEPTSTPDWIPDESQPERFLRVTRAGRLDELDRTHAQGGSMLRRPLPQAEHLQGYSARHPTLPEVRPASHRWLAWRLRGASWGIDTPEPLARSVRRALLALLGNNAPVAAHGHDHTCSHLAFLPISDVGHPHATGHVIGFAIALPGGLAPEDDSALMAALAMLHSVILPDRQVARLEPVLVSARLPKALHPSTWCAGRTGATTWSTVTPVILDRTPKRKTPEAIASAITQSLVNAGYPAPVEVTVRHTSDFQGAPRALDVPSPYPRYHARVRFAQALCGPVIAGRGRHFGIGLFRPLPQEN
ncbi:hypothetical protein ZRA01_23310 [Zoogloea ramigera]|uniref:Type I-U CRISPR-associated protein Cas5/Cas6 n=1 Tax=Zoogloea ramigera TaxID=350 RepID=A0A4Y4CTN8_ZOORA|nr:type I-U CRISPR-associated protein Csb2 [Zoogloea ramigera]GEC96258.1 hypothetical protein ZRA01_23310 [Zoogloea ramigera]